MNRSNPSRTNLSKLQPNSGNQARCDTIRVPAQPIAARALGIYRPYLDRYQRFKGLFHAIALAARRLPKGKDNDDYSSEPKSVGTQSGR